VNGDGLLGRYLYELLEDISKRAWTAAGRGVGTLLSRLLANILATRLVRGDQTVELRILVGFGRGVLRSLAQEQLRLRKMYDVSN
jgi:phage tail tape-measure protein